MLNCLMSSNHSAVDAYSPQPESLLGGGTGDLFAPATTDIQHPAVAWRQTDLQSAAASWVRQASTGVISVETPLPGRYEGVADQHGFKCTQQLCTTTCSCTFFPMSMQRGLVLWEPFGGLCAGLEMALRNGFTVRQYLYSDTDPVAQQVAMHRIRSLQTMYPLQLSEQAVQSAFQQLPMDVCQVTSEHLLQAVTANAGTPWLVVAGWPCQDLSLAGKAKGLQGNRSSLLTEVVRLIGLLQQMSPNMPPAYLVENVAFQHHRQQHIAHHDYQAVLEVLGNPVTLDAAQTGSLAHRLRNYWTNLCGTNHLASALKHVQRPSGRTVQGILPAHRVALPVSSDDRHPQFPCNKRLNPREAWPTLMATPLSYAFRPGQPGSVVDFTNPSCPTWQEPTANEREIAMGYLPGSTAAEGVSEAQRRQVLGQCIDANAAQVIMAISKAWWLRSRSAPAIMSSMVCTLSGQRDSVPVCELQDSSEPAATPHVCMNVSAVHECRIGERHHADGGPKLDLTACFPEGQQGDGLGVVNRRAVQLGLEGLVLTSRCTQLHTNSLGNSSNHDLLSATVPILWSTQDLQMSEAVGLAAEIVERSEHGVGGTADVWSDQPVLQVLQGKEPKHPSGPHRGAVDNRVRRRAAAYYFVGEQLIRRMPDSTTRIVPPPDQRHDIIRKIHHQYGHYGIRKTAALVRTQYWWSGFWNDVVTVVNSCEHCQRVNASFAAKPQELKSIPISSIGFRWHVDTAGPLPVSSNGNKYVLVAVEAFTKYLVAIPMKDKEASTTAYHFLHNVLARFGAPGQVVSDNGTEFAGDFAQLLSDSMIDHSHVSSDHPQANGQAEKAVHVVKRALTKLSAAKHNTSNWDADVAWLTLGYCCSTQSSTGISPYEMLYAREPIIPPAVSEAFSKSIDYDSVDEAVQDLLLRKQKVSQMTPMALQNMAIAQHRDQLRYLRVRAADYQPKQQHFHVGQYVYVQQLQRYSTLQPRAQPVVYRVLHIKESGVLTLQGKCGSTIEVHMSHCAPCNLLHIDGTIDPLLLEDVEAIMCEVCGTDDHSDVLLLCDICSSGYHTYCLQPPLDQVPDEDYWLCPTCVKEGYTLEEAARRATDRATLQEKAERAVLFPNAAMKRRDEAAQALDGYLIKQPFKDPTTKRRRLFWGKLHFRGIELLGHL